MAAKPYNGFPSWNAWNVSLWINNEEWLYNAATMASRAKVRCGKLQNVWRVRAAAFIADYGLTRTPDGARYSVASVAPVLREMAEG